MLFGSKNGMWKGNDVGYGALHEWINSHKPKPKLCECCMLVSPNDLANISGKYNRDVNDFEWLCRKCHMEKDGRLDKLQEFNNIKKLPIEEKRRRERLYNKQYRERNIEEIKQKDKARYIKNRDKILQRRRERYSLQKLRGHQWEQEFKKSRKRG